MRILLFGRKQACRELLDHLVGQGHEVTAVVTDSHLSGSTTTIRAQELGVPTLQLEDVIAGVADGSITYDLGLSMVYWRRIPTALIEAAHLGIVNFHPAPLPEYKGTAGYNLAILDGLEEWGVSAHYIDYSIDTGEIIEVDRFPIDPDCETAHSLERKSMARLLSQAERIVARISSEGTLVAHPNSGGRYVSRREMQEMKRVLPGDDVERKVRAFWFPPYAGATIELEGKTYTLVSEAILASLVADGETNLFSTQQTESQ